MQFLVIGGAGYIGSHFVKEAMTQGHQITVLDNLSRGHRESIPSSVTLIEANILDQQTLEKVLVQTSFDAVFHFAAFALVGESMQDPDLYYENNGEGVRALINAMRKTASRASLIFSSSCAVFGTPSRLPMKEDDAKNPISPYGRSKLLAEWLIEDASRAYGIKAISLRYFNACGASLAGDIGEDHQPETHLIPNIIRSVLKGEQLKIFGKNFPTHDGTCVRDYIHVLDLADAHIKAAEYLQAKSPGTYDVFHLGTGKGYSNLEIVQEMERVLGRKIAFQFDEPRPGDPPALFADNEKAKRLLSLRMRYSDLSTILDSSLKWHQSHPDGYVTSKSKEGAGNGQG